MPDIPLVLALHAFAVMAIGVPFVIGAALFDKLAERDASDLGVRNVDGGGVRGVGVRDVVASRATHHWYDPVAHPVRTAHEWRVAHAHPRRRTIL